MDSIRYEFPSINSLADSEKDHTAAGTANKTIATIEERFETAASGNRRIHFLRTLCESESVIVPSSRDQRGNSPRRCMRPYPCRLEQQFARKISSLIFPKRLGSSARQDRWESQSRNAPATKS